ncbi:MAG: hypothetical protein LBU35_01995, partial [Holosporales bacterium]|nr:hypothetical protein [Holosporales bacterium]
MNIKRLLMLSLLLVGLANVSFAAGITVDSRLLSIASNITTEQLTHTPREDIWGDGSVTLVAGDYNKIKAGYCFMTGLLNIARGITEVRVGERYIFLESNDNVIQAWTFITSDENLRRATKAAVGRLKDLRGALDRDSLNKADFRRDSLEPVVALLDVINATATLRPLRAAFYRNILKNGNADYAREFGEGRRRTAISEAKAGLKRLNQLILTAFAYDVSGLGIDYSSAAAAQVSDGQGGQRAVAEYVPKEMVLGAALQASVGSDA